MIKRNFKACVFVTVRGMAMGAADVVPGVSGGTIALLTGIYDELIYSLKKCGPEALFTLFKQGPKAFWSEINGNFLLSLFAGILISIKTFAAAIAWCLEHSPLLVWGFFTGLILASVVVLWRQQTHWRAREWGLCLLGMAFVVLISTVRPAHLPGNHWIMFAGGFIAIIAMILPGISGSFILLLLGLYTSVLAAVNENDLAALGSFALGAACGLMTFSRFLSWLLANFHRPTLAVLIGFLAGSLYVTWPWKVTLETAIDHHGEAIPLLQKNVWPMDFTSLSGLDSQFYLVLGMGFLGIVLVFFTDFLSNKASINH